MRYKVVLKAENSRDVVLDTDSRAEAVEVYNTYCEVVGVGVRVILLDGQQDISRTWRT